ncbi:hypothetical protein F66182_3368 [Fusarium sp. NRRL 66182]|nr:hypothetical protein F66182_3368 [Fusarium sp. NRRL 66182]
MIFSSRYEIDIPDVDLLTYLFGSEQDTPSTPIYIAADESSENIDKTQLQDLVKKLAAGLRKQLHIRDNDVVLMFSENSIWYPVVMLGTICAGGIFTGANPGYTCSELVHQLTVSGAKCIFTDTLRLDTAKQAARALGLPLSSLVLVDSEDANGAFGFPSLQSLLVHGSHPFQVIVDAQALADKPAVLNFSSGTTGLPKACVITHRNLVANAEQTLHLDRMARTRLGDPSYAVNDVHCAFLPFYHAMGILTYCVVNVKRCSTTVIMSKFDLESLLASIQSYKVTYLLLVPTVVPMLVNSPLVSQYDMSSVKFLLCGAAPLHRELERQLEALFSKTGARSRQGWGMSEATMAVTIFGPDEFDPTHQSVGYLVPNMQLKILDEDGQSLGYDQEGEAVIRGPNVFKGYYKNPAATKDSFTEDGWLKTGDIVKISKNGMFRIVDRKKELIKVKGFQVAPSELESHLLQHQGVQDCAVIRVLRNGKEQPQAHIVRTKPDVTPESILAFMDKRLSAHKRITGGIIFTDVIPKSSSEMSELETPVSAPLRKRATKACMGCRSRKVRCDVVHRPHQCTNCALDNAQCVVKARRTKYRKRAPSVSGGRKRIAFKNTFQQATKDATFAVINSPSPSEPHQPTALSNGSSDPGSGSPSACFDDLWDPARMGYLEDNPIHHSSDKGEESNILGTDTTTQKFEFHATARKGTRSDSQLTSQSHVIYSYYPFLDLDISGLSSSDVTYLEAQGCFGVPTREALDDFVREYFLHVHPGLPLLDEAVFWDMYLGNQQSRSGSTLSLFVFQAMLFASSSFLSFSTLQSLGFTSKRNARDTYYRRSKLLFDLCGERSLVSNSQGSLLLSYNANMKDQKRTNSIWLATAIHMAQAAGADQFHAISDQSPAAINELKRLWWCCIVRDRILPLGVRRQLHIASIDVYQDHYVLTEQDFAREMEESHVYGPQTKKTLIQLFITLCELAVPLTEVIKILYTTGRSPNVSSTILGNLETTRESIRSCEAGLETWFEKATIQFPTPAGIVSSEESLVLYTNLMYIYYYSARFALYQHEAFAISLGSKGNCLNDRLCQTRAQLEGATLGITDNLKELIQLKLGKFLPISMVAYAALPLVLHILDVKLANKPSQAAQKQGRLNVYMEAMKSMQNLYDGVDDVWTFIRAAVDFATEGDQNYEFWPLNRCSADPGTGPNVDSPNDWGNVLVREPILYFRLARTIDLSLAFERYLEDSSLCFSSVSARLPSPRLFLIDCTVPEQIVQVGALGSEKKCLDKNQVSEAGLDHFSVATPLLNEMDDLATYDFGVNDFETLISLDTFELGIGEVEP